MSQSCTKRVDDLHQRLCLIFAVHVNIKLLTLLQNYVWITKPIPTTLILYDTDIPHKLQHYIHSFMCLLIVSYDNFFFIHSFVLETYIAPLSRHYYSEALHKNNDFILHPAKTVHMFFKIYLSMKFTVTGQDRNVLGGTKCKGKAKFLN